MNVMETGVAADEGNRMLCAARADDRALPNYGQDMEEGEVWIDMHDADGDIVSTEPACFHRADAADALQLHFDAPAHVVARALSKSNVMARYRDHRAAVRFVVNGSR